MVIYHLLSFICDFILKRDFVHFFVIIMLEINNTFLGLIMIFICIYGVIVVNFCSSFREISVIVSIFMRSICCSCITSFLFVLTGVIICLEKIGSLLALIIATILCCLLAFEVFGLEDGGLAFYDLL